MKRAVRLMTILVVLELFSVAALVGWRLSRFAPPLPDLSSLDSYSATELGDLQHKVWLDRPDDWQTLGKVYLLNGFFPEADLCLRRATELDPNSHAAHFWWAVTLDRLGRTSEAIEQFTESAPLEPQGWSNPAWYYVGREYLREENVAQAEAAFRKTPAGFAPAAYDLARLLFRSGRPQEAVPLFDIMFKVGPDDRRYHQLRSRVARALGDLPNEAIHRDRADRADTEAPTRHISRMLLADRVHFGLTRRTSQANKLKDEGNLREAESEFSEILEINERVDVVWQLAQIKLALGKTDEAVKLLDILMEKGDPMAERLSSLGDSFLKAGLPEKARQLWERSIEYGGHGVAHLRLSSYYNQKGDQQKSRYHAAMANHFAGVAAFRQNRLKLAVKALSKTVELDPALAHSWFYLGESHRVLGNRADAENAFRRCLELKPQHGRAHRGLSKIHNGK